MLYFVFYAMKKLIAVSSMVLVAGIAYTAALSCTMEYNPVCGNDGQTYSNECMLWSKTWPEESMGYQYKGECVDLFQCASFYDGCNMCSVENGQIVACTERACIHHDEAYCMETIDDTQTGEVIDLPEAIKTQVNDIWHRAQQNREGYDQETQGEIYSALYTRIANIITEFGQFQMVASFTPEGAQKFQLKIDVYVYFNALVATKLEALQ